MAQRVALGDYDQLHHFIAAGVWDAGPVETELLVQADKLVGGRGGVVEPPIILTHNFPIPCASLAKTLNWTHEN
jgi:hypothetical protein